MLFMFQQKGTCRFSRIRQINNLTHPLHNAEVTGLLVNCFLGWWPGFLKLEDSMGRVIFTVDSLDRPVFWKTDSLTVIKSFMWIIREWYFYDKND